MNQTKRLEVLEAFASSKPTEFDGFARAYLEAHPEPVVESLVSLPVTSTDREVSVDFVLGEGEYSLPVTSKPKRTRKPKAVVEQTDTIKVTEE
jgi:hypothetical protein